ncbi:hypothetical protein ACLEQD_28925, partial [Corallococcus sp. 4LFB]
MLQFHHREAFEHTVTRALAAGAGAGLVQWLGLRMGLPVPLTWLVPAAVVLACARGDRWDRGLLSGLGLLLVGLPYGLGLSPAWTVATSGAAAGSLLVRSRLNDLGEEGQVAEARPTLVRLRPGRRAGRGAHPGGRRGGEHPVGAAGVRGHA